MAPYPWSDARRVAALARRVAALSPDRPKMDSKQELARADRAENALAGLLAAVRVGGFEYFIARDRPEVLSEARDILKCKVGDDI